MWRKLLRFGNRTLRNLIYSVGLGERLIQSADARARSFGPGDGRYAWSVFQRHAGNLARHDHAIAPTRILEFGPGRNLGHTLLWWCASEGNAKSITLYDAFENMRITPELVREWAVDLVAQRPEAGPRLSAKAWMLLEALAAGTQTVDIHYRVGAPEVMRVSGEGPFDLVLSQSALEHVYHLDEALRMLADVTSTGGIHSHQIDLKNHGTSKSHFLEMLEWSDWAYWVTMRFTPGAINRLRASAYVEAFGALDFEILEARRKCADALPVPRSRLARRFRDLDEEELLTIVLDVVLRKTGAP